MKTLLLIGVCVLILICAVGVYYAHKDRQNPFTIYLKPNGEVLFDGQPFELDSFKQVVDKEFEPGITETKEIKAMVAKVNMKPIIISAPSSHAQFSICLPLLSKLINEANCGNIYITTADSHDDPIPLPVLVDTTGIVFASEGRWHYFPNVHIQESPFEETEEYPILSGRLMPIVVYPDDQVDFYVKKAQSYQRQDIAWYAVIMFDSRKRPNVGVR